MSSTTVSKRPSQCSSYSLAIAQNSWVPATARGDLLVDAVGEHGLARALVGGEAGDQIVEGALGVEHRRPQLARGLDPVRGEQRRVDAPRLVVELGEAERGRQAPGGVDRHDRDPLPFAREPQRERGRGGGLAHATGADADADGAPGESPLQRDVAGGHGGMVWSPARPASQKRAHTPETPAQGPAPHRPYI